MCANLWTNEDKQLRIPRVMPSVFFAIAKPLLFVIDSFLPVLINHLDCSLSNSLQMGNGLAGKHLSGAQGPNSSQNGKPASSLPGRATQTRNHSLSKTPQDSTPILPLKRRRQGLEETLHSHALPTPGGDARRKLLPAFHGAGAPTTGACLGHERQKLETFCCTSRQSVEVLVLPPLIISRGTTTISCGYSSMALLKATSDGQVKGCRAIQPQEGTHRYLLASARRAHGWSRPQDRAPSSSEPALFDFQAQTRCFGTCCQHDRRRPPHGHMRA